MNYPRRNYLIFLVLVSFIFFLFEAKQKPTYNPFDDLFQVDVQQLAKDGCDTVPAGCGYYNLVKMEKDFAVYYQIYQFGSEKVEAKGFVFLMDTFRMNIPIYEHQYLDSLPLLPHKISRLADILNTFHFSIDSIGIDYIKIVSDNKKDTTNLNLDTRLITYSPRPVYVRSVDYFTAAPDPFPDNLREKVEAFSRNYY